MKDGLLYVGIEDLAKMFNGEVLTSEDPNERLNAYSSECMVRN